MTEYFSDVSKIAFEGKDSRNHLAFKHYDPEEEVEGKKMKDHMRFGAAYWHCMRNPLADPFGPGTALMPWDDGSDSVTPSSGLMFSLSSWIKQALITIAFMTAT